MIGERDDRAATAERDNHAMIGENGDLSGTPERSGRDMISESDDSARTSESGDRTGTGGEDETFEELAARVDSTIRALDAFPSELRDQAMALKSAIEAFHRPALVAIVRALKDDPAGKPLLFDLAARPEVRAVLALHGIIKTDPETRARQALNALDPYLRSQGADVELVEIDPAKASALVRWQGGRQGCSVSAENLQRSVTEALIEIDGIERVEVIDDRSTVAFIPVEAITVRRGESRSSPS